MGVSKNKGTPKWMIYNGKPYFLMDDLGEKNPLFSEPPPGVACCSSSLHSSTFDPPSSSSKLV